MNVTNNNYTKIKVNLTLSSDCKSCENDLKKRQLLQKNHIASLYPKGTFLSTFIINHINS